MAKMTLCPNCRTIQKAGTDCTICKCPVPRLVLMQEMLAGGGMKNTWVSADKAFIAYKPHVRRAMAVSGD